MKTKMNKNNQKFYLIQIREKVKHRKSNKKKLKFYMIEKMSMKINQDKVNNLYNMDR